jgi:hypothetical protein
MATECQQLRSDGWKTDPAMIGVFLSGAVPFAFANGTAESKDPYPSHT